MAVVGAAMRKLIHSVYGVLKTGRPFDPNYQPLQVGASDSSAITAADCLNGMPALA